MIARIVQWLFAAILLAAGGYLAVRGWELVALGGSPYYLVLGVGMAATAALVVLQSAWGPRLFALMTAATIGWAIYEAGLDFWALLPRLAAFIAVGIWFVTPWSRAAMRKEPGSAPRGGAWNLVSAGAAAALLVVAALQGYAVEEGSRFEAVAERDTDWRAYGGTAMGTRFGASDQINVNNVDGLEEAWRFRTRVPFDFKNTPIQIGDLLYTCTAGNVIIALDPDTGQERWRHDTQTKVPGAERGLGNASTFARTCRGVSYHEASPDFTGQCAKRILTGTTDARLIALDATTGVPCSDFGFDGEVNLRSGLGDHAPPLYFVTSPPLVAGDVVVVGGWVADTQQLGMPSGVIRAYNAITGAFVWAWDMGNPGYHGLPEEGGEFTRGTPNVWSIMSYDPDLNLIYAPTGNSSPDYFAGELRSEPAERYSASTVAIDAATGEVRWSFQTVHHDIWDYDVPSQPVLVDVRKDGAVIPAVAQPTKRGEIFLLDRRDGTPVYPIEERPVPQNPEEGEWVTATQPFSPLPHFREDRLERDMWGLTPLDQLFCRIEYKKMRYEGLFTPPMRGGGGGDTGQATYGGTFQYPGNAGGYNWGSVSVDADNGLLAAAPMMMGNRIVQRTREEMAAERAARMERAAAEAARRGDEHAQAAGPPQQAQQAPRPAEGQRPGGRAPDPRFDPAKVKYVADTQPFMSTWKIPFTDIATDVPCFEPPWSMIGVIDLNTNKLLWRRPLGSMKKSGPFGIQSGLPFMVGTPVQAGSITTRGGLIFHGGAMDSTFRAFDLRTGEVRWESDLPGSAHATPMTYVSAKTGKQYVVITVPNPTWQYPRYNAPSEPSDDQGGYVIAYALPDAAN